MSKKTTTNHNIITTTHHHPRHSSTTYASTVTQIDFVTSTFYVPPTPTTTQATSLSPSNELEGVWEHRIHRFLPVLLAFAIIGILTVIGSLIYLIYRLYQAHKHKRRRRNPSTDIVFHEEKQNSPISATLSHIIPWLSIPSPRHPTDTSNDDYNYYTNYQPKQKEPIRYEKSDLHKIMKEDASQKRPSLTPSWLLSKLFSNASKKNDKKRAMSLPIIFSNNERSTAIDNLNVPISSTFVPIDTSSLTLVPRSEIWQDPTRRRGVDELDMWERKNSGALTIVAPTTSDDTPTPLLWRFPSNQDAYPDSPESFGGRRFSEPDQQQVKKKKRLIFFFLKKRHDLTPFLAHSSSNHSEITKIKTK